MLVLELLELTPVTLEKYAFFSTQDIVTTLFSSIISMVMSLFLIPDLFDFDNSSVSFLLVVAVPFFIVTSPIFVIRPVTESIMITGFFGYVGMMMGIFLTEGINYMMTMSAAGGGDDGMSVFKNPTVDLKIVLASTLVLIVAGIFAGYMPARRAVRIKPIEAMREE